MEGIHTRIIYIRHVCWLCWFPFTRSNSAQQICNKYAVCCAKKHLGDSKVFENQPQSTVAKAACVQYFHWWRWQEVTQLFNCRKGFIYQMVKATKMEGELIKVYLSLIKWHLFSLPAYLYDSSQSCPVTHGQLPNCIQQPTTKSGQNQVANI